MNAEMKYVVLTSKLGEQMVVFPKTFNHSDMADVLNHVRHTHGLNWMRVQKTPVSAGFTDGMNCYGRSESLNLDARIPADTALLKMGGQG